MTVPGGMANGAGTPTAEGGGGATGAESGLGVVPFGAAARGLRGAPLVGRVGGGGAGVAAGMTAIFFIYKIIITRRGRGYYLDLDIAMKIVKACIFGGQ